MAYYYVKNGGTATGDAGRYATQQTGSFATLGAANYYGTIALAMAATTSPVDGDFINPSDVHLSSGTAHVTWFGAANSGEFVNVFTVSDLNINVSRRTGNYAEEVISSGSSDFLVGDNIRLSGLKVGISDDIIFKKNVILSDSIINSFPTGGTGSDIVTTGNSVQFKFFNVDVEAANNNCSILINRGNYFEMIGGSYLTTDTGISNFLEFDGAFQGNVVRISGVDITGVSGTLCANVGASNNDAMIDIVFDMCKLRTGVSFTNETFKSVGQRALFTRCSDSSAAAEYQYALCCFGGGTDASGGPGVEDDSAIFRNEDEAFTESNQKISYKIVTNSDASLGSPLWLDFPVLRYSELSAGATDTLRFYLTSNTALTDKDVYIEISYPDGTNKQTPNFLTSAPVTVGGTLDLMAAGTTLTTDSTSTWTGGLTNKYQIDLNTSVDVGADCLPIVKVYITKPSITIQIASEFGLS